MIDPTLEDAKQGPGDFHDAVIVEFADPDRDAFGLLRVTRAPNQKRASAMAVVCSPDSSQLETVCGDFEVDPPDWGQVEVGPVRMATERALERWTASLRTERCKLELALEAETPPIEFSESEVSSVAGVGQYEQLCTVTGSLEIGDSKHKLRCSGRRVHVWGAPDWNRVAVRRSLYFASPENGLAMLGVRPSGADHDHDVLAAWLVRDGGEPEPCGEVMLSTVLDAQSQPHSAGIELHLSAEDLTNRLAGEAICKASLEAAGRLHRISFFRWSLDGKPGWGSYQTVSPVA